LTIPLRKPDFTDPPKSDLHGSAADTYATAILLVDVI